ncbi:MarR family winged helix-turn-helix transcriptional regulator [Sphingobium lactosutens]|uniref:MarR family winged helix-turn-helix transcriptional regulator n=1 Tax=Sphingobium lactosutens TaxID=522773 RepID=UPI002119A362|nr:MarR family winged helix-turn-helix transcriptional regulator [Sphingobium lactosutens]
MPVRLDSANPSTMDEDEVIGKIARMPEKSFGYLVRRCHRRFDRLLNARLATHDIKTGFWYYLRVLWIRDQVTQKYLSDMTNVAENTTVTMIEGMVNSGLVQREVDATDKRKRLVGLTPYGRSLENKLMGHAVEINRIATRGIKEEDLEVSRRVLARMSENLQQELRREGVG